MVNFPLMISTSYSIENWALSRHSIGTSFEHLVFSTVAHQEGIKGDTLGNEVGQFHRQELYQDSMLMLSI